MLPMMSSAILLVGAFEVAAVDLLDEMLLEGLVADDGIEEELAALLVLLATWRSS